MKRFKNRKDRLLPGRILRCLAVLVAAQVPAAGPIVGLDHIPIAVKDLDAASADFRALGFTLKPGRLHADSILNDHAKFADLTELELVTASAPKDALAGKYLRLIAAGEGPAFFAMRGDPKAIEAAFAKAGLARKAGSDWLELEDPSLDYLFFVAANASPTERPDYLAQANTASTLVGVWIADRDNASLRKLLRVFGATPARRSPLAPALHAWPTEVFAVNNGEITLLPAAARRLPDRPIVGAVLRVVSLDAAIKAVAAAGGAPIDRITSSPRYVSFTLPPERTHGLWLEFREYRARELSTAIPRPRRAARGAKSTPWIR